MDTKVHRKFFLETGYPHTGPSKHEFPLGDVDVLDLLFELRNGRSFYEILPGIKNRFLGGKDTKLKYGCFFENQSMSYMERNWFTEPEQVGGLVLPHYQVLSREAMEDKVMSLELDVINNSLYVHALDDFPEAEQFHRMRGFDFEPVKTEDVVLNSDQLAL